MLKSTFGRPARLCSENVMDAETDLPRSGQGGEAVGPEEAEESLWCAVPNETPAPASSHAIAEPKENSELLLDSVIPQLDPQTLWVSHFTVSPGDSTYAGGSFPHSRPIPSLLHISVWVSNPTCPQIQCVQSYTPLPLPPAPPLPSGPVSQ